VYMPGEKGMERSITIFEGGLGREKTIDNREGRCYDGELGGWSESNPFQKKTENGVL